MSNTDESVRKGKRRYTEQKKVKIQETSESKGVDLVGGRRGGWVKNGKRFRIEYQTTKVTQKRFMILTKQTPDSRVP